MLTPEISLAQLREFLRAKECSATEVTSWYLQQIAKLNPILGAFTTVTAEQALERASALDKEFNNSHMPLPHLWGVPLGHKDLVDVAGVPTTYGSRAFSTVATADDALVATLTVAGSISLGKTQVPEFGLSGYSENLIAPPARNPFAPGFSAGGSSGGAAAAVAAGLLPVSPGSDAGGSIRIPAACCGLIGLKPGRGRIPADCTKGSGLDMTVQGPIARTALDAAILFDAMRADSAEHTVATLQKTLPSLKIAYSFSSVFDSALEIAVAPEVEQAVFTAASLLREYGHTVTAADFNYLPGYYTDFTNSWQAQFALQNFSATQVELFGAYTRHCYAQGQKLSPQEVSASQHNLLRIAHHAAAMWSEFDVVLTPTLNLAPRAIGFFEGADPQTNFRLQCESMPYTSVVNVTGLPAISVPLQDSAYRFEGAGNLEGLAAAWQQPMYLQRPVPVGVQLIGRPGAEALLLQLAQLLTST